MPKHCRPELNIHNSTKNMGKSWASKGADHEKLKSLLLNNKKVVEMQPKAVFQEFGFQSAGYDLNSFRNGLNRLKRDLSSSSTKQMSSELNIFKFEEGKVICSFCY